MSRSIDTFMWILMALGVVLSIGLAVVALGDLSAEARYRVLGSYALSAVLFAYATLCFLDALLFSSASDQADAVRSRVAKQAALKRAIGIVCAVFAVAIIIALNR